MSKVALKGSSKLVSDYFEYALNNILYQRGIYPQEDFITVKKFDLPMIKCNDDDICKYIENIMIQIRKWIYSKRIEKFVIVIISKSNLDNIERWEFDVKSENEEIEKDQIETQKEIQTIIRQITSSVSYLPVLKDDDYTFNVLVYTDPNTSIPIEWIDTEGDGKILQGDNIDNVNFTSFSTKFHHVNTSVSYKYT
ncbi:unnamed protein product [Candida verbasci]|uniref:HORMA domain-containing protein n=1 Tax=Candida verbasci TaxID=1227364 RepID=A0A9W4XG94_9ASCO|nr:unnamed protein product [Candida verbasci]